MAPSYKLTYFDAAWRPEPLRMMFAYKKVEYIDNRIKHKDWNDVKPTLPYGQVPILEFDGCVLAESYAIMRYIAKQLGLAGKNDLDAAKADMFLDYIRPCYDHPLRLEHFFSKDDERKKAIEVKLANEIVPLYFANLERDLSQNGGIYFVGDEVTWADFVIAHAVEGLEEDCAQVKPILKDYPKLEAHLKRIMTLPGVKEWIENRPKGEF